MPDSWFSEEKMHKNFIRDVYAMFNTSDGTFKHSKCVTVLVVVQIPDYTLDATSTFGIVIHSV